MTTSADPLVFLSDSRTAPVPAAAASVDAGRQLESAEAALREISQRLAHDLRTPLRHVVSYTGLLEEDIRLDRPSDELAARTRKIQEAAQRLVDRLDDLAALSRVLGSELLRQPTDMSRLLAQAWAAHMAAGGLQDMVLEQCTALPVVTGDATLLEQVWSVLIHDLGRLHSPAAGGGRLLASAAASETGWTFRLRLVPACADADRPVCAPASPDEQCSCESGRALVRRILGSHGGCFWVLTDPDQGPGFAFMLPRFPLA